MPRSAFTDRVAAYFTAHPLEWIHAREFETIGGRQAWRSRISDCRILHGMVIENWQVRRTLEDGTRITDSYYRYVPRPETPLGPDASEPRARSLF